MSIQWWEKIIHDLHWSSLTFHDLPWSSMIFHVLWPSMTFYHLLRPLWPSMIKCLLSRPGLISGPLHFTPLQINSQSIQRLDPIDSMSSFVCWPSYQKFDNKNLLNNLNDINIFMWHQSWARYQDRIQSGTNPGQRASEKIFQLPVAHV